MKQSIFLNILFGLQLCFFQIVLGQTITPIVEFHVSSKGQAQIKINASNDHYYVLRIRHDLTSDFTQSVSMTMGQNGRIQLTEPLGHYPPEQYQVVAYPMFLPNDTDGDSLNDIIEFQNMPFQSPFNPAHSIDSLDGIVSLNSFDRFQSMAIKNEFVQWSEFLNGKEYLKFILTDMDTPNPKIYFIHGKTHALHLDFSNAIGLNNFGTGVKKGQIIYHPTSISNNGTLGTFAFNFSNGHGDNFQIVQKAHELIAAQMPFLENNLSYLVTERSHDEFERDEALFQDSRIPLLFENDAYAGLNYWGLHPAEGFGLFRKMNLEETPNLKDIVLYEALPNELPRVGGIMTSALQTPLSHVNLRAIQNNIPNAFLRHPLEIDSIAQLLNQFVYYKVEPSSFYLRQATLEEVNTWFDALRPKDAQSPPLNLDYTDILPLDDIHFDMYDGFGAKCANLATMRTFGFPDGTIPDGYGIPFFYYQAFMKENGLFKDAEKMMADPDFISDRSVRDAKLKDFRKDIKNATVPAWMLNDLTELQAHFPQGVSIRCRSSTNNEDLPGFNGAGLYDSKTQHPDEGHISKSILQVYASLWNLRAFEERDFYRVDHFQTSMAVLCHPNFLDERVNGVAVTADPIYQTENTYYLNLQVGDVLITNPAATEVPEELLLYQQADSTGEFVTLQYSSLLNQDSSLIDIAHLREMRTYLSIIHKEFARLYRATEEDKFAMDIEFKITKEGQLSIKQARPWVNFLSSEKPADRDVLKLKIYPNPSPDFITVTSPDVSLSQILLYDITGKLILEQQLDNTENQPIKVDIQGLSSGIYVVHALTQNGQIVRGERFLKE